MPARCRRPRRRQRAVRTAGRQARRGPRALVRGPREERVRPREQRGVVQHGNGEPRRTHRPTVRARDRPACGRRHAPCRSAFARRASRRPLPASFRERGHHAHRHVRAAVRERLVVERVAGMGFAGIDQEHVAGLQHMQLAGAHGERAAAGVQDAHHVVVVQVVRERPDIPGQRAYLHDGPVGKRERPHLARAHTPRPLLRLRAFDPLAFASHTPDLLSQRHSIVHAHAAALVRYCAPGGRRTYRPSGAQHLAACPAARPPPHPRLAPHRPPRPRKREGTRFPRSPRRAVPSDGGCRAL